MRRRNALTIRILQGTAVRSAELYKPRWEHVDLEEARRNIPKSKTGAAMDIPVAPIVVDWFKELRTLAGGPPRSPLRASIGESRQGRSSAEPHVLQGSSRLLVLRRRHIQK